MPIHCQYTISPTIIQSVHHFSCQTQSAAEHYLSYPCPVRILPVLPTSFQNTTSPVHVQSVHHLYCQCWVSMPSPQAMSHLYAFSIIHVQIIPYLYSPCPISIPSLQPIFNLIPISAGYVQTVLIFTDNVQTKPHMHLYSPCPYLWWNLTQFMWPTFPLSFLIQTLYPHIWKVKGLCW